MRTVLSPIGNPDGYSNKVLQEMKNLLLESSQDVEQAELAKIAAQEAGTEAAQNAIIALSDAITSATEIATAAAVNAAVVKFTIIYNIPTDFPTLQDAVNSLQGRDIGANVSIELNIETGHAVSTGLYVSNGDYAYIKITSDEDFINASSNFVGVGTQDSTDPDTQNCFILGENAKMPVLATKFSGNGFVTNGYWANQGSVGKLERFPVDNTESKSGITQCDYNIVATSGSTIYCEKSFSNNPSKVAYLCSGGSRIFASNSTSVYIGNLSTPTAFNVEDGGEIIANDAVTDGYDTPLNVNSGTLIAKRISTQNWRTFALRNNAGDVNVSNADLGTLPQNKTTHFSLSNGSETIANLTRAVRGSYTLNEVFHYGSLFGILIADPVVVTEKPVEIQAPIISGIVDNNAVLEVESIGQFTGVDQSFGQGASVGYWSSEGGGTNISTDYTYTVLDRLEGPFWWSTVASNEFGQIISESNKISYIYPDNPYIIDGNNAIIVSHFVEDNFYVNFLPQDPEFNFTVDRVGSAYRRNSDGNWVVVTTGKGRYPHYEYDEDTNTLVNRGLLFEAKGSENRWLYSNNINGNVLEQSVSINNQTGVVTCDSGTKLHRIYLPCTPSNGAMAFQVDLTYINHPFLQILDDVFEENFLNVNIQTGAITRRGSNTRAWTSKTIIPSTGVESYILYVVFDDAVPTSGNIGISFATSGSSDYKELFAGIGVEQYKPNWFQLEPGDKHSSVILTNGSIGVRNPELFETTFYDTPELSQGLTLQINGRARYEDNNLAEEFVLFNQIVNGFTDGIKLFVSTAGEARGVVTMQNTEDGNTTYLTENNVVNGSLIPQSNTKSTPFNIVTTWSETVMNLSVNGLASSPVAIAELKNKASLDADWFTNFNGTIKNYTVYVGDIGLNNRNTLSYQSEIVTEPAKAPNSPILNGVAGDQVVNVSWSTPATNGSPITGYLVRYLDNSSNLSIQITVGIQNTYQIKDLIDDQEIIITVEALSEAGNSEPSNSITRRTFGLPSKMAAPTVTGIEGGVIVEYVAPESNGFTINDYEIEVTTV